MSTIATHMRITGLQVTDDDVNSRKGAVTALKTAWGKQNVVQGIFAKAAEVAEALGGDGTPSPSLGEEVQVAVQKKGASAFLYSERPLDVGIVAGVAAAEYLASSSPGRTGYYTADIWAAALWSALSFQPALQDAKREALRGWVLQAAMDRCLAGADAARERIKVPDFKDVSSEAAEGLSLPEQIKVAAEGTIDALRRNAALDREEIDFLWWTQLGRSRLLDRPLLGINEPTRLVASGLEAARYLRRLPSTAHRELVLRTLAANPELDLSELLQELGADRALLGAQFADGRATQSPSIFPLINALATGSAVAEGAIVKRSAEEWAGRALLEAALVQITVKGPAEL